MTTPSSAPQTPPQTTIAPPSAPEPAEPAPEDTVPGTTVPEALAFTQVLAVNDYLLLTDQTSLIDVRSNDESGSDLRVTALTQPQVGSASLLENGLIEVTIPRSFAGSVTFEYDIADENGQTDTATVAVESANVLAPVGQLVSGDNGDLSSLDGLIARAGMLFGGLISIRLSTFQLALLSFTPPVLGLFYWILRRREQLVSVTDIERATFLEAENSVDSAAIPVRHDSVVWTRLKTRLHRNQQQTLVELPSGTKAWVPTENIVDTGY